MQYDGVDGYATEEDETIACGVVVGSITIVDGEVLVEHLQPADTVEDAFWSRVCTLLFGAVEWEGGIFSDAHVERLYDLLSAHDMECSVREVLERGGVRAVLRGFGLTYTVNHEVYVDEEGYRTGDLRFTVHVRNRVRTRACMCHPRPSL